MVEPLKVLTFNQDSTCIAAATEKSLAVFNCDPFDVSYKNTDYTATIMELLFSTSLAAIVDPKQHNKCLKIINIKKDTTICELSFVTEIIDVKMNRKRMIIVLTDKILIYDVSCMKLLHQIDISSNNLFKSNDKKLSCAISSSDASLLAFQQTHPESNINQENSEGTDDNNNNDKNYNNSKENFGHQSGNVVIFDTLKLVPISIINCHKTSIEKLVLSENGALLASASIKGTIIRVFDTKTSKKVCEFRRGRLPATVTSLAFNQENTILACASLNGTIHFFKIKPEISEIGLRSASSLRTSANMTPQMRSLLSASSPHELPHSSELTSNEAEEIRCLMDSIHTEDLSSKNNKKASQPRTSTIDKTKKLKDLLWSSSKKYLPENITSILQPERDFAYIRLASPGRCVVGLVDQTCYVAAFNGLFLHYLLPSASSSASSTGPIECIPVKQHAISI
jgi:autophagy-related protein 18